MNIAMTADPAQIDLKNVNWADWEEDPYPLYRALRDRSPVFHAPHHGVYGSYLITRYDDVASILMDVERFSNIPLNLLDVDPGERISPLRMADPPRHTWLRATIMPLFTSREMRNREPYLKALATDLLDQCEAKGDVVEVSSQLAIPLPGRVTCDILGLPLEYHQKFINFTVERRELSSAQQRKEAYGAKTFDDVREEMWAIVEPIATARRAKPEVDAISLMINAQAKVGKDQIPDKLIIDMLLLLLTGGFHTTQHLVENFLSIMADRPDLWTQMREDRSLVAPAIEEMLRYDAPVQMLPRRARHDVEVAGTVIPANATLAMVYGAANRDERAYPDPDSFRLDRKEPKRQLSFSGGIHTCPGAPVSRAEVLWLIQEMLNRYKTLERTGPSVRWPGAGFRGYQHVPLRFVRG